MWSILEAGLLAPDREVLNPRGLPLLGQALAAIARPELDPDFLALVARAAVTTLGYAFLGSALSVVLGTTFGVLASRTWWSTVLPGRSSADDRPSPAGRAAWLLVRGALVAPRAVHEVLWGVLLIRLLGLDPLVAILAIGVPYGAITAKVFSELIDEAPPASLRALTSAGARPLSAFVYGAVPNALSELVSYAFYRLECSIRAAAVLGIFGAGGLGFQLQLSLRSLRYEEVWTIVGALILLTGAVDLWSGRARRSLGVGVNPRLSGTRSAAPLKVEQATPRKARSSVRGHVVAAALAVPFAWVVVQPDPSTVFGKETLLRASELLASAWPPTAGDLGLAGLMDGVRLTLAMSILAAALAAAIALPLAVPAARNAYSHTGLVPKPGQAKFPGVLLVPSALARSALLVLRAVPPPLWALLILFVVRPGVLPGALAIGLYTGGIVGRLTAEVIENVESAPPRALALAGASTGSVLAYGVAPIALPRFLLYIVYRWEECVRATVVVGLVGAGGLGHILREQLVSFHYAAIAGSVLAFIGLALVADMFSAKIRGAFR